MLSAEKIAPKVEKNSFVVSIDISWIRDRGQKNLNVGFKEKYSVALQSKIANKTYCFVNSYLLSIIKYFNSHKLTKSVFLIDIHCLNSLIEFLDNPDEIINGLIDSRWRSSKRKRKLFYSKIRQFLQNHEIKISYSVLKVFE